MAIMNPPTVKVPRKPKLRSSCDACGAAKLKCNRGQPKCQRCVTLGISCVYGISRKMGKPPRSRPKLPPVNNSVDLTAGRTDSTTKPTDGSYPGNAASTPFTSTFDNGQVPMAWSPVQDQTNSHQFDALFDAFADSTSNPNPDFYGESLPQVLPELLTKSTSRPHDQILRHRTGSDDALLSRHQESELENILASVELGDVSPPSIDSAWLRDGSSVYTVNSTGPDYFNEAYTILGQLSLLDHGIGRSTPSTRQSSISTTSSALSDIPLDRILHRSRDARERLTHILRSASMQAPLAFLCASIVSTILRWYQQATASVQSKSYDARIAIREGMSNHVIQPKSRLGSCSPRSGGGGGAVPCSSGDSTGLAGGVVALRKVSIGTFNVDDSNMETTLAAQVLLSELGRLGAVIELFLQRRKQEDSVSDYGVVKSIHSWLVRLHTHTADGVRELSKGTMY